MSKECGNPSLNVLRTRIRLVPARFTVYFVGPRTSLLFSPLPNCRDARFVQACER